MAAENRKDQSRSTARAGRGRRASSPPQFGQTYAISSLQSAQNVHSNVQM